MAKHGLNSVKFRKSARSADLTQGFDRPSELAMELTVEVLRVLIFGELVPMKLVKWSVFTLNAE